jgi:hypothetical protein
LGVIEKPLEKGHALALGTASSGAIIGFPFGNKNVYISNINATTDGGVSVDFATGAYKATIVGADLPRPVEEFNQKPASFFFRQAGRPLSEVEVKTLQPHVDRYALALEMSRVDNPSKRAEVANFTAFKTNLDMLVDFYKNNTPLNGTPAHPIDNA